MDKRLIVFFYATFFILNTRLAINTLIYQVLLMMLYVFSSSLSFLSLSTANYLQQDDDNTEGNS
jgi:hypothetical protein